MEALTRGWVRRYILFSVMLLRTVTEAVFNSCIRGLDTPTCDRGVTDAQPTKKTPAARKDGGPTRARTAQVFPHPAPGYQWRSVPVTTYIMMNRDGYKYASKDIQPSIPSPPLPSRASRGHLGTYIRRRCYRCPNPLKEPRGLEG